jgi:exopolysaccharide biosynthesis polyprenyl glycosylphosphotransferase
MHELKKKILVNLLRTVDLSAMVFAFGMALVISGHSGDATGVNEYLAVRIKLSNFLFFLCWLITWYLIFRAFRLYKSQRAGFMASEWWTVTKAVAVGTLILSFAATILEFSAVNIVFLASFFSVTLVGTIVGRLLLRSFFTESRRTGGSLRKLVIIGCGPRGEEYGRRIRRKSELGYLLLGYIDDIPPPENPLHGGPEKVLGPTSRAREILSALEVDEVVISLPIASHYRTISNIISICEDLAVDVMLPADFFKSPLVAAAIDDSRAWPAFTLKSQTPSAGAIMVKRVIDIIGSGLALFVLSPVFVAISIAIKRDSRGPVLFVQERVGLKRKKFKMLKFRTMRVDSEELLKDLENQNEVKGAAFKMASDPRITRVGRLLRKMSLDELPQFYNVFRGDMSLVGPRPLPLRDVERFDQNWQKRRFSVKPGLTCLWQVNGRHKIDFDHWMELDLEYIDNWSLSMDFDILLKTVPAVLKGTGAS